MKKNTKFYDESGVIINPYITPQKEFFIQMFDENEFETERLILSFEKKELKDFIDYLTYLHNQI